MARPAPSRPPAQGPEVKEPCPSHHRGRSRAARAARELTVEYLDLADYVVIAAEVTGLETEKVLRVANLGLADSALHAPRAGFGEAEFYPGFVDKAAVAQPA